ncbi:unnamed protein product [Dovyalis caffra]|uniref:Uncharacterized protein n=1 Tax=Dovyalis caffra TaxID=77055 RepID=A0AAV1R0U6_9ROSI|nr:unnamed protein product [Dovyalis caffra]
MGETCFFSQENDDFLGTEDLNIYTKQIKWRTPTDRIRIEKTRPTFVGAQPRSTYKVMHMENHEVQASTPIKEPLDVKDQDSGRSNMIIKRKSENIGRKSTCRKR